ncbi:hypothetical protein LX77_00548 [Gelidibacter algens]|jgi:hypothetical protein|uniref:Uncharacterized protein n=1 Tax=Gelidibacter algens TaxID=49280 RepID=A0A1A7R5D7_9FLAO|nr:DUF6327 family protein [Gelidibacter algens]OBX27071.1 hypothetical protein A9996_01460 [Gelidibacter algens]RAJ27974.1 hypothetical protein LX77_00548 [Gelidibacter algens]
MKSYKSFDDIDYELNKLKLEREIAWEELKVVKNEFQEDLRPFNWVSTGLKFAGKYGVFVLLKKIIGK